MFQVTGLKILGRVGTHIFFKYFFTWKKYNFISILKDINLSFKMHKLARHINPSLVLVQPRKTCPDLTERLLTGT